MMARRALMLVNGLGAPVGGIATVAQMTAQALTDLGLELDVLALATPHQATEGNGVQGLQMLRGFSGSKLRFVVAAWVALLRSRYDEVIVDHVNIAASIAPLAWLGLARYTVWLYGLEVFHPLPSLRGKLGLLGASRRLAISPYTRDSVLARYPRLAVRLCELALPPGSEPRDPGKRATAERRPLPSITGRARELGAQVILHVGRMVLGARDKGQAVLLRALPSVRRRLPGAQLVLAGAGEDFGRVMALASSLEPADAEAVFMPGLVSHELLDELYETCAVFAMPSVGEGFGLTYLEAMSRGKACLGANSHATPGIVRDGVSGLLVNDAGSADEVADRLVELLGDPDRAETLGRTGSALVRSMYLFPHFRQRLAAALGVS